MTRNSDLYLQDIFGCKHEPETPISQDGEIIHWRCRCGRVVPLKKKAEEPKAER